MELLAKEEREPATFGFAIPDVGWTRLAFRVQNLMSCSWVAQPLTQQLAGQCCAAQPGSEVKGASAPQRAGRVAGLCGGVPALRWQPGARVVNKMHLLPEGKGVWRRSVPAQRPCWDCSSLSASLSGEKGKRLTLSASHVSELEPLQSTSKGQKGQRRRPVWLADQGGCSRFL